MNIPLIPDKFYKLLVYLGIGLIIYAWVSRQNDYQVYEKKRIEFNVEIKKIENQSKYLDLELKDIYSEADYLSKKNAIKNPLSITDTSYKFSQVLIGNYIEKNVSDSIMKLLSKYDQKNKEFRLKNDELLIKKYELEELKGSLVEIETFSMQMMVIGSILAFIGSFLWFAYEFNENEILRRQNLDKPSFSSYCQSCGKYFNSMIRYGTEDNGQKNYHFCSNCYSNGCFTEKELTLPELKEKLKKELILKKRSKLMIRIILNRLSNLERWKN